jgi:hypothetical protein
MTFFLYEPLGMLEVVKLSVWLVSFQLIDR